ncbi:ATP-binding cassette domain-containing protein [Trujillonella endophytica]|uniref:Simple sugar transport system ATP-binding protein n=1 Tax=Trujillonella endophytica TaxID=673521 RepID=A0A1H8UGB3_9ACTN|nr:ATP-binding cassette domain-containing protein [Trujillella endophytica]SEP02282.1 simple sugar transport system ATP-binding protein [Trujillella endophytica]
MSADDVPGGPGPVVPGPPPVLALGQVTVRHGSVAALSRVSAEFAPGTITCVLGENGSGKSTLVSVLSGLTRPDEGSLLLDGRPARFRSARDARAAGIATVWNDLSVAPLMSVWRNFCLGAEPTAGMWPLRRVDLAAARELTARELAKVGMAGVDPDQPASGLRPGERQSLAIARALHFGSRALLVDEPIAPRSVAGATQAGQALLAARARGLAVVVVTANPRYAHLIGDRFLLLAGGQVAGRLTREDVDADSLTRLMAGDDELTALTDEIERTHPDWNAR